MLTLSCACTRRQLLAGSAALALACALPSFALAADAAASAGADGAPEVDFDGPFIVGFDQDFPPYGYVDDNGDYAGVDIDFARAVCEMEGWELQLEPIAWDAKDALLNSGQITCIWNGFTIEGREDDYVFTDGYMENGQVIVTRSDSGIETLEDLAGKTVLTQTDSTALHLLSEGGAQEELGATFGELQTIGEFNTGFMMLTMGTVDAVAIDYTAAVFQIGDDTDDYKILGDKLDTEHDGVGFAKGNEALRDRVQYDLIQLDKQGKVKEIIEKYADQGLTYDMWVLGKEKDSDGETSAASSADEKASSGK